MKNEYKISLVLSFISGFIDTAGFIALFGLFTAHVTGNLVLAGAAFFDPDMAGDLAGKLAMLPVFVCSVMFTTYLIRYKKATVVQLVIIEALFITGFSLIGQPLFQASQSQGSFMVPVTAAFAVIGMGIQNTYMRKLLNKFTPTTVMTGNFTQFSIDVFTLTDQLLSKNPGLNKEEMKSFRRNFGKVMVVLAGFLGGCVLGASLVMRTGLVCCLLPAVLLLWVAWQLDRNKQAPE